MKSLYRQYSKSKKSIKMAAISKVQVRITKYLMCIYGGHMCICILRMKFLCLALCQGEVYTNANANDDDANDDGQFMIV